MTMEGVMDELQQHSTGLYHLTTTDPLWSDATDAIVAADSKEQAKTCMTCGSDSLWSSVDTCEFIGCIARSALKSFYKNAEGCVITTWPRRMT